MTRLIPRPWRLVLVLLAAVSLVALATPVRADDPVVDPPSAPTPSPWPEPPAGSRGLLPFLPNPKEWAADVFNATLVALLQKIADALHSVVNGVLGSSLNFITQTPPAGSYASPTVQALWGVTRAIANAALVLITLWSGFNLIARDSLGAPYHDLLEMLPRLALNALLVNTSLTWGQLAIDANNALCKAIGGATLPAWERADLASQVLADLVAAVIYLVASLLLLLQTLARLALIDILLVAAPLALLCWALPQTQGWARLWSSTFVGAVFTQFLQVLALKLGGSLLTELTPMALDSALLSLFLGVAVMALTLKIPGLMRYHLGDGMGFVRYVVYRRAASTLEGVSTTHTARSESVSTRNTSSGGTSPAAPRTRGGSA
ncbi:MAG: hypothetical protein KIS91_11910 [Anaerolineae bacterium]|nr:hypothetical protein [Anaerolineae bacterium]